VSALSARMRNEAGQAIVFVVFALMSIVGMGALVIDGGSWLRAQRHLQTAADAAALAGAQNLPTDQSGARSQAVSYAQQNYSGLGAPAVTFPDPGTIDVVATTSAPGFLARIYGAVFNNVTVRAHARAQVSVPLDLKNVAPVAVKNTVACAATNPGCYGQTVTLRFNESQVASSTIGLINLTCYSSASTGCGSSAGIGGSQLKDWIDNGYPSALPANMWYGVKTGETVGPVKQGFTDRVGVPLFFPVFDQVANDSNNNYFFHIIGWAAFVIDPGGIVWGPQGRQLTGHFTTFIATDLAAGGTISGASDFGVHVITLVQ
jgi:Flp pilus assembly protein TadG